VKPAPRATQEIERNVSTATGCAAISPGFDSQIHHDVATGLE
jgi:hypothetical protein